MAIRVFFFAFLLLASPFLQVVRCQSDIDAEAAAEVVEEGGLGIVGDDIQDFGDVSSSPAPGVDTVCVFPKNAARVVPAGEETELLVGVNNEATTFRYEKRDGLRGSHHDVYVFIYAVDSFGQIILGYASKNETDPKLKWTTLWEEHLNGESALNVVAIRASIHLPFDHHLLVQNLTVQEFTNSQVPVSAQATFPYIFVVNKYLQPGSFDLVGTIFYEVDQQLHQSVFYNGTIEVVEAGGFLSVESVFLVTLGVSLIVLLGLWINGQIQHLSKKTKRAPKVEVGTGTTDASVDEWLQGTAYAQSLSSNKSKKKK